MYIVQLMKDVCRNDLAVSGCLCLQRKRATSRVLAGNTFTGSYAAAILRASNSGTIGWSMKIHSRPTLLFLGSAVRKVHILHLHTILMGNPRQICPIKAKLVLAEIFPFFT